MIDSSLINSQEYISSSYLQNTVFVFPSDDANNQTAQCPRRLLHRDKSYAIEARPWGVREEFQEGTSHWFHLTIAHWQVTLYISFKLEFYYVATSNYKLIPLSDEFWIQWPKRREHSIRGKASDTWSYQEVCSQASLLSHGSNVWIGSNHAFSVVLSAGAIRW